MFDIRILLIALITLSILPDPTWAQARAIRQNRITERQNELSRSAKSPEKDTYKKEADVLMNQLEVITGNEETRYIIVPGDTVRVTFTDRNEKNTGVYQVSAEGAIHLPLAGPVQISGLNRKQARDTINSKLADFIRYPNAVLQINADGKFMVMGAGGPGAFTLTPNLTVMEAILMAGYDRQKSNLSSVIVMRGSLDEPVIMRLNLYKMIMKGDRRDNIVVKPGDLIYIPTSFIWHLEKFKDNMLKLMADYYTLGGTPPLSEGTTTTTVTEE